MRIFSVGRILEEQEYIIGHEYFLRAQAFVYLKKCLKQKRLTSTSLLPFLVAACGGGGGGPSTTTPVAPSVPTPTPDFTESPIGTFTARDDTDRTLSQGTATRNLTVNGLGGSDSITTGSGADVIDGGAGNDTVTSNAGNDVVRGGTGDDTLTTGAGDDMILGGAGTDVISAGDGDDIIVVIGTTTVSEYSATAITSPAGTGTDLSALIALTDINGHDVSDISGAESIDGGTGNNTLVIYGTVDLTGVTLSNVTTLYVNSTLSLTAAQIADFTTVKGDGSSELTITGSDDPANPAQLDLSMVDISGIDSIASSGYVEILVTSSADLAGLSNILTSTELTVTITGTVNASDLVGLIESGATINLAASAIFVYDSTAAVEALSDIVFSGGGTIETSDVVSGAADILAAKETTATVTIGTSVMGEVGIEHDKDWYAVTMEAGQVYQYTLIGLFSGLGTLEDPRIDGLYNSNGDMLVGTFNDDGLGNRESLMLFTPEVSGTYYISVGGWDTTTGTYQLDVTNVTETHGGDLPYGPTNAETFPLVDEIEFSNDFRIDSLLSGFRYSEDPDGAQTTITYSFPLDNSNYSTRSTGYDDPTGDGEPWNGFGPINNLQQEYYQSYAEYASALLNIELVQVADTHGSAGTIRVAWTADEEETAGAWAYHPASYPFAGDIWLSNTGIVGRFRSDENYLNFIYMHETGHALGLTHPFDGDVILPLEYDSYDWSVMAYNYTNLVSDEYSTDLYPQTYMYFDILALQYMYGPITYNEGDTTYTFDGNERYYLTVWDTGGTDTFNYVNQGAGIAINLTTDGWLDVGTTISYQTDSNGTITNDLTVFLPDEALIENVYGSFHDDTITGNEVVNHILGRAGDDSLDGKAGADIIDGGLGKDTLTGGDGADTFIVRAGDGSSQVIDTDIVLDFSDGQDLVGLNGLAFSDLTILDGSGDNAGDTLIQVTLSGEYLVVLDGVAASDITVDDFTSIQDDWWVA